MSGGLVGRLECTTWSKVFVPEVTARAYLTAGSIMLDSGRGVGQVKWEEHPSTWKQKG